jgi:hypothetical protein
MHECEDFGLVRDIADAHKHVVIDRASRKITGSDQTQTGTIGYGQGGYGEGVYGGADQLVVTLDDGSKRALSGVMQNVIAMWQRILHQHSL